MSEANENTVRDYFQFFHDVVADDCAANGMWTKQLGKPTDEKEFLIQVS